MAAAMLAVVVVTAVTGIISLRKTFSTSEQYATGLADQTRLLGYLALDLRRAVVPPVMDPDDQGVQMTVPDCFRFDRSDPQHLFPIVNGPGAPRAGTQTIAYRFLNGSITRTDPWLPLVKGGAGYVSSGPVTIASNMESFPTLSVEPTGATLRYTVTFHPAFQPQAEADPGSVVTVVRGENLAR